MGQASGRFSIVDCRGWAPSNLATGADAVQSGQRTGRPSMIGPYCRGLRHGRRCEPWSAAPSSSLVSPVACAGVSVARGGRIALLGDRPLRHPGAGRPDPLWGSSVGSKLTVRIPRVTGAGCGAAQPRRPTLMCPSSGVLRYPIRMEIGQGQAVFDSYATRYPLTHVVINVWLHLPALKGRIAQSGCRCACRRPAADPGRYRLC